MVKKIRYTRLIFFLNRRNATIPNQIAPNRSAVNKSRYIAAFTPRVHPGRSLRRAPVCHSARDRLHSVGVGTSHRLSAYLTGFACGRAEHRLARLQAVAATAADWGARVE